MAGVRKVNGPLSYLKTAALLTTLLLALSCAAERTQYHDQVEVLLGDLNMTYPETAEEVFDFAMRTSYQVNLGLPGVTDVLVKYLNGSGPWHEKLLLAYLLALVENRDGFASTIRQVNRSSLDPRCREGLHYCGLKYLGIAERDTPPALSGWEISLEVWREALKRIDKIGLHNWRLEYIQEIVLSNRPSRFDEAHVAASWLSFVLHPSDVPFLSDLLGKGGDGCDDALLTMIENLLMRTFVPSEGADPLQGRKAAFEAWFETNQDRAPDQWITDAFQEAGYKVKDLYSQASVSKLLQGLYDETERWVLIRSHTVAALNRICGFQVDRNIIFEEREVRQEAAQAYMKWYKDLASRVIR
jgi:hypothetical protein